MDNISTNFNGLNNLPDSNQLRTALISVSVPAATAGGAAVNFCGTFEQNTIIVDVRPTAAIPATGQVATWTLQALSTGDTTRTICTFVPGAAVNSPPATVSRFQLPASTDGNFRLQISPDALTGIAAVTVSLAITYCNAH